MIRPLILFLQLLLLVACLSTQGLAVDRSKFRTCDKTSFCRRHRHDHSQQLYKYKVVRDSVEFHIPEHNKKDVEDKEQQEKAAGGSFLWKSVQQRLLGNNSQETETTNKDDPYVRGPPPTLTGRLLNVADQTSTGTTEQLDFSIHCMSDGLVRFRVKEVLGGAGSAHETPRVTYDDLVLHTDTLQAAEHALWIPPSTDNVKLAKFLPSKDQDLDKYMALEYGDDQDEPGMMLLIRLEPFALFLYRQDDSADTGPILTVGNEDRFHFEIRRHKDDSGKEEEEKPVVKEETEAKKEDGKPEKEIVGYWEDGLAIYSDGTREEKKVDEEDEEDDDQEADHRKLSQLELDQEGMWEEKFQDHHDSKPFGPTSVGMDIHFPHSQHLYGLPEHASSTLLKKTTGEGAEYEDPYRLYNLDVFEYDLDVPMALYGAVPLIVSQSVKTQTAGVFWFNPSETFVDIHDNSGSNGLSSHWISESGIVDLFLIPGPTPHDVYRQYAHLTGTMPLPPMFSLGYHQCRWNYKDEQDVYQVHDKFEELDYPYDVLWLDIEHTDGKRYFTWDKNLFPNPEEMQDKLWSQGRRMVTIVDPHVKRDDKYYTHKEATAKGLYIKDKDGKKDFDGWCWPGASSYLDFTNEEARSWWADQFGYDRYKGSTPSLFTWNDMNEPSVFNGPEVSMQKDLVNLNGEEHREWHNLYGMLFQRATAEGLVKRNKPDQNIRPFVLSRAFFAGSQQYGAIWTGDNAAEWSHLAIASPMLLSLNVGALSFVGADVGGFFGNTDAELMTRWMQAGAYTPFFRGHAHHDAKRREPWMFGEETMVRLRKAAMSRYALLPYWYSMFREAGVTGMPVMRTMWMQYPKTEALFSVDDQYLIGADLLVKPVTAPGVTETEVKFPTDDVWYDADKLIKVSDKSSSNSVVEKTVPSDIDTIAVFQRGGSILPRKLRLRRSSYLMASDPYTLYVALAHDKTASGVLYMDDETTFDHAVKECFAEAQFTVDFAAGTMRNTVTVGAGWIETADNLESSRAIERIVFMGVDKVPKSMSMDDRTLDFTYDDSSQVLVVRKPHVSALTDWELTATF